MYRVKKNSKREKGCMTKQTIASNNELLSPNGLIQQQQENYFGNNGPYIWKQVRIEPQKSI
jgi:hypothetical protein